MKVGDKITIKVSRLQRFKDWLVGYRRYPVISGLDYDFVMSAKKEKKTNSKGGK